MSDEKRNVNGIGFVGALQLIFITLKLLGVIDWSWVWVLAPTWISFIITMIILFVIIVYAIRRDEGGIL